MRNLFILATIIFQVGHATAEVKYLNDVIQQETQGQNVDLAKVLNDIQLSPATDPDTGSSVFKVTGVTSGSVYEKAGIKVGDLVAMGNAPKKGHQKLGFKKGQVIKSMNGENVDSPARAMELYNQMKKDGQDQIETEPSN